jgi:hypothetical protein
MMQTELAMSGAAATHDARVRSGDMDELRSVADARWYLRTVGLTGTLTRCAGPLPALPSLLIVALPSNMGDSKHMATQARTAAERQAACRKARPTAGENSERRISSWVSTGTTLALNHLARRNGATQRDMLERLIKAADGDIVTTLDSTSPEWAAHFAYTVTPLTRYRVTRHGATA